MESFYTQCKSNLQDCPHFVINNIISVILSINKIYRTRLNDNISKPNSIFNITGRNQWILLGDGVHQATCSQVRQFIS